MKVGRILIACEYSGCVRNAFARVGWDAWSADLLPSETEGNHFQGDVFKIINDGWDAMIAHPPCTHLCVSGARWFKDKVVEQAQALDFVRSLLDAPIRHIALENPISVISSKIRKPDQNHTTVAAWSRRDKGHMFVVEEFSETCAKQCCRWSGWSSMEDGTRREQMEGTISHIAWYCGSNGEPVVECNAGEFE